MITNERTTAEMCECMCSTVYARMAHLIDSTFGFVQQSICWDMLNEARDLDGIATEKRHMLVHPTGIKCLGHRNHMMGADWRMKND